MLCTLGGELLRTEQVHMPLPVARLRNAERSTCAYAASAADRAPVHMPPRRVHRAGTDAECHIRVTGIVTLPADWHMHIAAYMCVCTCVHT